eukprot:514495-Pelagomonas_calceolata.AAC.1
MVHLTACTLLLLSPLVGKLMPDEYKCYGSTASSPLHICRMTQVPCVDSAMCHVPCVDSAMCHVPCVDSAMCHVPCVDVPCVDSDSHLVLRMATLLRRSRRWRASTSILQMRRCAFADEECPFADEKADTIIWKCSLRHASKQHANNCHDWLCFR